MNKLALAFAALALSTGGSAYASQRSPQASQQQLRYHSDITGNVVMQVCSDPNWTPGRYDPCGALLIGIIDGLEWGGAVCRPYGVLNIQLSQLAFDAIKKHPEEWDKAAGFVIRRRLASLYPCQR